MMKHPQPPVLLADPQPDLVGLQDRSAEEICADRRGNYLKRWGFTPQKPIRRAYEQRPEAARKWLDEEYPAIAERANPRAVRYIGAMKRRSSTPTFGAAAMPRRTTRPWPTRRAGDRNCR